MVEMTKDIANNMVNKAEKLARETFDKADEYINSVGKKLDKIFW